jgi:hypothetical protein
MDAHKDNAIRQKYSAALMSNQKWRKFFSVMAEHAPQLCGMEYRFTDTDNVLIGSAPDLQQVWETAIDDPVQGAGGPIEYKHIESITIPRVFMYRAYDKAPLSEIEQDIDSFVKALEGVGIFPVVVQKDFVVIQGYEKT